jgi:hypothetical protein
MNICNNLCNSTRLLLDIAIPAVIELLANNSGLLYLLNLYVDTHHRRSVHLPFHPPSSPLLCRTCLDHFSHGSILPTTYNRTDEKQHKVALQHSGKPSNLKLPGHESHEQWEELPF